MFIRKNVSLKSEVLLEFIIRETYAWGVKVSSNAYTILIHAIILVSKAAL